MYSEVYLLLNVNFGGLGGYRVRILVYRCRGLWWALEELLLPNIGLTPSSQDSKAGETASFAVDKKSPGIQVHIFLETNGGKTCRFSPK